MDTDAKLLNMPANQTQQHIKMIVHHDRVRFITEMQD